MKLTRSYIDRAGTVIYAVLNDSGNSLGEIWKHTDRLWRNDRTGKANYKTKREAAKALASK